MRNRLLSIGVTDTPKLPRLRFAGRDAVRIHQTLTGALGFFEPHEARVMANERATAANVRARLAVWAQSPKDHVLVFFTGHGGEDGIRFADGRRLSYDELGRLLRAIPASTKTIILATCHAGAARRIVEHRVGGVGDGHVRRAWLQALRAACPGIRVIAAVGEGAVAHEASELGTGRFVYGLLHALRRTAGDIHIGDAAFISDGRAVRAARRIISRRWPDEPGPELYADVPTGTLPLVRSQVPAPIGLAYIDAVSAAADFAAEIGLCTFERRGVTARIVWDVMAMTGAHVGSGALEVVPPHDIARGAFLLPADEHLILGDPYLGTWLRAGAGIELRWDVRVVDDVGRVLARAAHSAIHVLDVRAA